jgi:CDP-4-dehydro-6-deoxyglucose reductase, E3
MPQLLSLSRAARLAGVSRGELQQRIRIQGITTFEGQIQVRDLLLLYPQVNLDHDPVLERLEHIKATAQPKTQAGDGWLPAPEVLMSRLYELNRVLVRTKTALNAAERLLGDIQVRLAAPDGAAAINEIQAWIDRALSQPAADLDQDAQLFARDMLLKVMTASVKVHPSGHELFVEGNESILTAGLRAGLHLGYGCSSGNCGACRARVIQGEARQLQEHDFVLSERERDQGYILTCSWTAVTDLEIEAMEAREARDLPRQHIRTQVVKVEPISEEGAVLHLRTPRTQTLRFLAGQSARLTDEDGNSHSYPIASCPCDSRNLEFIIRHRDGNAFARTVLDRRIKSQLVQVEGPSGDFVLREDSTDPALFLAFGDGFAPIKSLLEHAISIDTAEHLYLYRVDEPLGRSRLDNLCRAWSDSLDNFSFTLLGPDVTAAEALQRLWEDVPRLAHCHLYVAGPGPQVDAFLAAATGVLDAQRITWQRDTP